MLLVYFLQVLDGVVTLFWAGVVLAIVAVVMFSIWYFSEKECKKMKERHLTDIGEEERSRLYAAQEELKVAESSYNNSKKWLITSCISACVLVFLLVIVPTKKQAIEIVAVGSAIEFATNNEKIMQLPDKLVDCIDAYLSDIEDNKE